jgi:hypothetical protein
VKQYLIVTGTIFGLVGLAHLLRLFVEPHPWSDYGFLGPNLLVVFLGGAVAVWATRLLLQLHARRR